jgi:26S proteasome regulatory subunit N2
LRQKNEKVEKNLEEVVNRMFERCFSDGEYKQAIGLSLDSKRIDKLEESILKSGKVTEMTKYCFELAQKTVPNREFRHEVLKSVVKLFESLENPDYFGISEALLFLDGKQEFTLTFLKRC